MKERPDPVMTDPAQILSARARTLARPLEDGTAPEALLGVVEFQLGKSRFAVESEYVSEVHPLKNLTPLPSTPPFVLGIVNIRGRIVPVYDLSDLFGLSAHGLTDLHKIVIIAGNGLQLGLLAHAGVAVRVIPHERLQLSLPTLTGIHGDHLKGITADGLVVLDVRRILADPRIIVHQEVAG